MQFNHLLIDKPVVCFSDRDLHAPMLPYQLVERQLQRPYQIKQLPVLCLDAASDEGFDASDPKQRMTAAHNLLGEISWTGTSNFMSDIAKRRTIDLCERMNVTKELMGRLLLAAGGRGGISGDGGGVSGELTNWDGTKKKNGWGIS